MHLDEAEIGERADAHGGTLGRLIDGESAVDSEITGESCDEGFGFANDNVVGFEFCGRHAAGDGSADDGAQAARTAAFDDCDEMLLLRMHAADHGNVGPREVGVGEPFHIGVDQALGPACGEQRCNGHESKRGLGGALALEGERVLEAPVGVGKSGIDQKCVHSPMQLSCRGGSGAMGIQKDYRGGGDGKEQIRRF